MTAPRKCDVDVVVIGAGFAGLGAALALRQAGRSVRVLEANGRVGGRTLSRRLDDGSVVELGGAWVGPGHQRLKALADRLGVARFPSYHEGCNMLETDAGVCRFNGTLPVSSEYSRRALSAALDALESLSAGIDIARVWRSVDAGELDGQTFAAWIAANVCDAEAASVLRLICEAVLAVDPADVSLLHLLFYGRASGGLAGLIGINGGAQDERFETGAQSLAGCIAGELGDAVSLNSRVEHVSWEDAGVCVAAGGQSITASAAIVAVPPRSAARLAYAPALPPAREALLKAVPPASAMKCVAVYERPFWRDAGLSGHGRSLIGPVKGFFDVTPLSGVPGMLLGFVEGAQARAFRCLPAEDRRRAATTGMARLFGTHALKPSHYLDFDFSAEPDIGGCYAGYFPPGIWTRDQVNIRDPIGPLHWAGTETAEAWYGYMEGAVLSGERAASEVLRADR
jgi:monoamine oxidase